MMILFLKMLLSKAELNLQTKKKVRFLIQKKLFTLLGETSKIHK